MRASQLFFRCLSGDSSSCDAVISAPGFDVLSNLLPIILHQSHLLLPLLEFGELRRQHLGLHAEPLFALQRSDYRIGELGRVSRREGNVMNATASAVD